MNKNTLNEENIGLVVREPSIEDQIQAAEVMGGLRMAQAIRGYVTAQVLDGCIAVEKTKAWRRAGYKSFGDFLDKNQEIHGFGRTKYYELEKFRSQEGPAVFNVLSKHKVQKQIRRLLLENNVEVHIVDNDLEINGERVPVDDKKAVNELLEAVKDTLDARDRKIEKQKQQIAERDAVIVRDISASMVRELNLNNLDSLTTKLIDLSSAFEKVIREVDALPPDAREEWRELIWGMVADRGKALQDAFQIVRVLEPKVEEFVEKNKDLTDEEFTAKAIDEALESFFDHDDLELDHQIKQKNNDAELTEAL